MQVIYIHVVIKTGLSRVSNSLSNYQLASYEGAEYHNPAKDSLYYKFQETLKYGLIRWGRIEEMVTRYKNPLKKTRDDYLHPEITTCTMVLPQFIHKVNWNIYYY